MSGAMEEVSISFNVTEPRGGWLLEEETVPEPPLHGEIIALLAEILQHHAKSSGRSVLIARDLACRWDPKDARVGTDPDIVWLEPAPEEGVELSSLRIWEPGRQPPRIAIEVVSKNTPEKDYLQGPLRGARLGTQELWILDPRAYGPDVTGGPFPIQVWERTPAAGNVAAHMSRIYAGPGPGYSPQLDAWVVMGEEGQVRVASDADGADLWPTRAEAVEKAARARVAELEAKLRAAGIEP